MTVTLAEATQMLDTAVKEASSMGVLVSVVIVDPRGDAVAAGRMDGARFFTIDVARGKAMASASFRRPSADLTELGASDPGKKLNELHGGWLFFVRGAVPITKGGEVVGAIGVSGGSSEDDERIAKAGAAAGTAS